MHRPGQRHIKRVVAELGGKNAVIVDADADPDQAVPGVVVLGVRLRRPEVLGGQPRHRRRRRLRRRRRTPRRGDRRGRSSATPTDPAVLVGPLIDADAHERLATAAATAEGEGRVVGRWTGARPRRRLVRPAARRRRRRPGDVDAVARRALRTAARASSGPTTFDDAIALANDTDYALTAGCWSRSPANLRRAAAELRAGNVYLNRAHHRRRRRPPAVRRLRHVRRRLEGGRSRLPAPVLRPSRRDREHACARASCPSRRERARSGRASRTVIVAALGVLGGALAAVGTVDRLVHDRDRRHRRAGRVDHRPGGAGRAAPSSPGPSPPASAPRSVLLGRRPHDGQGRSSSRPAASRRSSPSPASSTPRARTDEVEEAFGIPADRVSAEVGTGLWFVALGGISELAAGVLARSSAEEEGGEAVLETRSSVHP